MSEDIKKIPSKKEIPSNNGTSDLAVANQCKNCGYHLFSGQKFCPSCGAKRIKNRLTARNLLEDFAERFLNIENVFLKTFLHLFTKPQEVINGYVEGLRKRYMPAFGYFAVAITMASLYTFFFRNWFLNPDSLGMFSVGFADGADLEDQEFVLKIMNFIFDYQSILSFLNIPLYAILSKIVFWNYKKFNFVEHLVIHLYAYSQFQILSSIIGIVFIWSSTAQTIIGMSTLVVSIGYTGYVLYKVFSLTLKKLLIKTLFFLIVLLPFSCIFFSVTGGLMYAGGVFDGIIEETKEQIEVRKESIDTLHIDNNIIRKDSVSNIKPLN